MARDLEGLSLGEDADAAGLMEVAGDEFALELPHAAERQATPSFSLARRPLDCSESRLRVVERLIFPV